MNDEHPDNYIPDPSITEHQDDTFPWFEIFMSIIIFLGALYIVAHLNGLI